MSLHEAALSPRSRRIAAVAHRAAGALGVHKGAQAHGLGVPVAHAAAARLGALEAHAGRAAEAGGLAGAGGAARLAPAVLERVARGAAHAPAGRQAGAERAQCRRRRCGGRNGNGRGGQIAAASNLRVSPRAAVSTIILVLHAQRHLGRRTCSRQQSRSACWDGDDQSGSAARRERPAVGRRLRRLLRCLESRCIAEKAHQRPAAAPREPGAISPSGPASLGAED